MINCVESLCLPVEENEAILADKSAIKWQHATVFIARSLS
jgi:hypothetical protein